MAHRMRIRHNAVDSRRTRERAARIGERRGGGKGDDVLLKVERENSKTLPARLSARGVDFDKGLNA